MLLTTVTVQHQRPCFSHSDTSLQLYSLLR